LTDAARVPAHAFWGRDSASLVRVPTVIRDPAPAEFDALLERRRRLGQDLFDEVWEGVLHVNPAPHSRHGKVDAQLARLLYDPAREAGLVGSGPINLGEPGDFRVPDRALLRPSPDDVYLPTAALVVEIVSPDDDTWRKLDFYAAHRVDEVLIVDPQERKAHWLGLAGGEYRELERSALIALGPTELADLIDWPQ
jgi:Uma2 family endonuclease